MTSDIFWSILAFVTCPKETERSTPATFSFEDNLLMRAMIFKISIVSVWASMNANSSPPILAMISSERQPRLMTSATLIKSWSPIKCPKESLNSFKPSFKMILTVGQHAHQSNDGVMVVLLGCLGI